MLKNGVNEMLKKFLPAAFVEDVFHIRPEHLKERGIKGMIIDLDNTLVAWDRPDATPEIIEWLEGMREAGIRVVIVSNNNKLRVAAFSEPIKIPFIAKANKPLGGAFRRALKVLGTRREETIVVGDQLLTDIFGGNRQKLHTILVSQVAASDAKITTFNRNLESFIKSRLRKRGLVYWEES